VGEGEKVILDPPPPSPGHSQHPPLQGDPDVDQGQRQACQQKAILGIPAGCPGSRLIHHPIAALHPEAATVLLAHIGDGATQIPDDHVRQVFHLVFAPFPFGIAAHNPKVHFLAPVLGTYHRVGRLIAPAPPAKALHALPVNLGRDDAGEGLSFQETNDLHGVEVSVQIQAAQTDPYLLQTRQEALQNFKKGIVCLNISEGQSDPLVPLDDIGGGVAVKTRCPLISARCPLECIRRFRLLFWR